MSKSKSSHIKVSQSCISERASTLPPSGIRKFFDLLSSIEGVISLGVGEPDFVTPWHICEAAIYSLEKGYTMYTSNKGTPELRAELARHLKSRFGLTYDPDDEILITVGVSEGLDLAMRAILNPGDEVIMPDPCYVAYPAAVSLAGGTPVLVPTIEENNFEITADDIEPRITRKTKAILIGYPCNPTGAVLSKEELTQIAELAKRYNLLVISDEVYGRLVYGTEHTCLATLPGMRERTILLNGFSKAYAMTLCSFLMDPTLETFVFSRLEEAKNQGLIDKPKMNLLIAAFRGSLLINALALLYKAETGGVTGKELLAIIDGTMQIPKDNFLHTLAVLIRDSIKTLPKEKAWPLLKELLNQYDDEQLQIESLVEPTASFLSLWDKDLSPMTFNANPA